MLNSAFVSNQDCCLTIISAIFLSLVLTVLTQVVKDMISSLLEEYQEMRFVLIVVHQVSIVCCKIINVAVVNISKSHRKT